MRPTGLPMTAVESVRTEPMRRVTVPHAKAVHIMAGAARIHTATGLHELQSGSVFVLGAGRWCSVEPTPRVRTWTVYMDEDFLRCQLRWVFTGSTQLRESMPSIYDWNGSALVHVVGIDNLRQMEPLWREISLVSSQDHLEFAVANLISLLAQLIQIALPTIVTSGHQTSAPYPLPITGRLAQGSIHPAVELAVTFLRTRMAESWTVSQLAREVAMSRSHLSRTFSRQVGVSPFRFLSEVRLTEFTRLIEETDLPVYVAARRAGWDDSRVAAAWFRRRFGVSPTQFRSHPHPSRSDDFAHRRLRDDGRGIGDA